MDLHARAVKLAKDYLHTEKELIKVLQQIDVKRLYHKLGFPSLFQYTVSLGLSENQAYTLISVSRKCRTVPLLHNAVMSGKVTANTAKKMLSVITQENAAAWISKAQILRQKELEKAVAAENPATAIPDKIKPLAENVSLFQAGINDRLTKKIARIKQLVCQSQQKPCSLAEVLEAMADLYLKSKDPVLRAERRQAKLVARRVQIPTATQKNSNSENPTNSELSPTDRLQLRDQGRCRGKLPNGQRCDAKVFLDFHHIIPKSKGGPDTLENLITLCDFHHRQEHKL